MHIVLKVCLTLVLNNHPGQLFQKFGFRCVWVLIIMLKGLQPNALSFEKPWSGLKLSPCHLWNEVDLCDFA